MPTKTKAAPVIEEDTAFEDMTAVTDGFMEGPEEEAEQETCEPEEAPEPARLAGEELLAFYDEKQAIGRRHAEIAYDAGYYTVTKSGQERVTMAQFNAALLAAKGVDIGDKASGGGRSHAGLTKARVSGQGILLVSQLATRHVGAEPGHVFEVSYPGDGQILLSPTGEVKPVVPRKAKVEEEPGTPLLDQAA
jgi:hypothetical protein